MSHDLADLAARFKAAQQRVNALSERPSNAALLNLYAHYKQATEGDCSGERPGSFDFVNRAKFDAWAALRGQDTKAAMQAYIDAVAQLTQG